MEERKRERGGGREREREKEREKEREMERDCGEISESIHVLTVKSIGFSPNCKRWKPFSDPPS